MNDHQFALLIQEVQICRNEIIEKLEAIRCGIIDYENEVKNFREQKDSADKPKKCEHGRGCGDYCEPCGRIHGG